MDKQSYLNSIAVKGANPSTNNRPIITPLIVKLIAVGVVLIIAMLLVAHMLTSNKNHYTEQYEELAYTYEKLANSDSPFESYFEKLRSSEVRAAATVFHTSVKNSNTQIQNALSTVKVSSGDYSSKVTEKVDLNISVLESAIESGYMAGRADHAYATSLNNLIIQLISLNSELRSHTDSDAMATAIDNAQRDLQNIQTQINSYLHLRSTK